MFALKRIFTVIIFTLLLMSTYPAIAFEKLNTQQVKTLFSNKTVTYKHDKLGFDFVVYHALDGSLRGTRQGQTMSELRWSVNNNGELCIAYDQHQRCHPIMLDNGVYKKYTLTENGGRKILVTYREFINGNPNNF